MSADVIAAARAVLDAARKRLMSGGKGGNGVEAAYAEAYADLCKVDPESRPNRRKYR